MTRYEWAKKIIEQTATENRRICKASKCACNGCISSKGVRESELKLYFEGKL